MGDNSSTKEAIVYITRHAPWDRGESFVLTETLMMGRYYDMRLFPLRPSRQVIHEEGEKLTSRAIGFSFLSPAALLSLARLASLQPRKMLSLVWILLKNSRSVKIFLKNAAVLPKAAWLVSRASLLGIKHLHAYWANTPATLAYCVSFLTGLPWSMTAHSGDIDENNMLAEKARRASFVRAISERGRRELWERIPPGCADKVKIIHVGVTVPESHSGLYVPSLGKPVLASVASLVGLKGHRYLLQACQLLATRCMSFQCWIIGDGPLRRELTKMARALGLDGWVRFWGFLPHQQVLDLYKTGQVQLCVQPSIRMPDGEDEGIPVSLMEALSFGLPVVATRSGAISELIEDQVTGVLVPPADPGALADAIQSLLTDPQLCRQMGQRGRQKLEKEFNLEIISRQLAKVMGELMGPDNTLGQEGGPL